MTSVDTNINISNGGQSGEIVTVTWSRSLQNDENASNDSIRNFGSNDCNTGMHQINKTAKQPQVFDFSSKTPTQSLSQTFAPSRSMTCTSTSIQFTEKKQRLRLPVE